MRKRMFVLLAVFALATLGLSGISTAFAAQGQIIVAKSGGDFTTIQAAINSVTPSATNPYIIKVMPGTYIENIQINSKSYISLEGAGRDVTTIQSTDTSSIAVWVLRANNVTISGFTIQGGDRGLYNYQTTGPITIKENTFTNNNIDISNEDGQAIISGNRIIHNHWSMYSHGIGNGHSSVTILGNSITGNIGYGIYNNGNSPLINGNTISGFDIGIHNYNASPTIIANSITNNGLRGAAGANVGILNAWHSSATISGNKISGNALGITNATSDPTITGNTIIGNNTYGLSNNSASAPIVTNNRITGNGGGTYQDIYVSTDSAPNISSNVYDTISGTTGVGLYNVKSDGTPVPAP